MGFQHPVRSSTDVLRRRLRGCSSVRSRWVDSRIAYERNQGKKATAFCIARHRRDGAVVREEGWRSIEKIDVAVGGRQMFESGELAICDGKGVWKIRTFHRKPLIERWDPKTIDLVPPTRTCDGDPNAHREMPDFFVLLETMGEGEGEGEGREEEGRGGRGEERRGDERRGSVGLRKLFRTNVLCPDVCT